MTQNKAKILLMNAGIPANRTVFCQGMVYSHLKVSLVLLVANIKWRLSAPQNHRKFPDNCFLFFFFFSSSSLWTWSLSSTNPPCLQSGIPSGSLWDGRVYWEDKEKGGSIIPVPQALSPIRTVKTGVWVGNRPLWPLTSAKSVLGQGQVLCVCYCIQIPPPGLEYHCL